jgi:hydrogenase maturation factor
MHDPTEGGFMGGLGEICRLTNLSADICSGAVPVHEFTRRAAKYLGFDPLRIVASGSMMAVVPEDKAASAEAAFASSGSPGIALTRVGRMRERDAGERFEDPAEELWSLLKLERP